MLLLAGQVSATLDATTDPVPAVTAGSPVAPAPASPAPVATDPTAEDYSTGQAQLMTGFIQVGAAAETMSGDLDERTVVLNAMQGDFAVYRAAISQFRTTASTATLSPDVRQKVDADLVPAIDRVLADLDTLLDLVEPEPALRCRRPPADRLAGDGHRSHGRRRRLTRGGTARCGEQPPHRAILPRHGGRMPGQRRGWAARCTTARGQVAPHRRRGRDLVGGRCSSCSSARAGAAQRVKP